MLTTTCPAHHQRSLAAMEAGLTYTWATVKISSSWWLIGDPFWENRPRPSTRPSLATTSVRAASSTHVAPQTISVTTIHMSDDPRFCSSEQRRTRSSKGTRGKLASFPDQLPPSDHVYVCISQLLCNARYTIHLSNTATGHRISSAVPEHERCASQGRCMSIPKPGLSLALAMHL